ncbi:unnamed protein product [Cladocopium goreaui]|uniref:Endonuclease/exonuclease/phosphatase domain-containing protein n=1 Tax=Cladocopium goreaui TaxID=2562237 RepID=A0A9P1BGL9_9DINO|nr:unnamed protein product [Cladocopium goreaui]
MGRLRLASRCMALLVAVHRTQGLATTTFSESFSGAAADGLRLRVLSWNVAAVNNNPFEYWITHPKSEYKQLMESVERFISQPGEEDVMVHEVFTDEMFQRLMERMRSAELEGIDVVEKLWSSTYRTRRIVTEFLRDPVIGKKRLASMPDRVTNTIQLMQGRTYRPSVVNCYVGELGSLEVWFSKWLSFFFEENVDLDHSGSKKVYTLLQKIRKKKYPAISEEEEAASIPLQLMMQGIFDAILMRLMLRTDVSTSWEDLRREICDSLNSKKNELIKGILQETYKDADVLFLQEAGNELLTLLREKYTDAFHIAVPRSFSNERAQNSIILLRRSIFAEPTEVEVPADGWDPGDLLLLRCQVHQGPEIALASFHGDTNGLLTVPMLSKVWRHVPVSRLVFGLDANTHEKKVDGKAHVLDFEETYRGLGLQACWGDVKPKLYTTFNARTYLQPQLNKAAKSNELEEKGDRNPKDFVLFTKHFKVGDVIRDNTGEGRYVEDMVFPTLQFPSDHALVAVDLLLDSSERSEL